MLDPVYSNQGTKDFMTSQDSRHHDESGQPSGPPRSVLISGPKGFPSKAPDPGGGSAVRQNKIQEGCTTEGFKFNL